jgi:hypothetical protein
VRIVVGAAGLQLAWKLLPAIHFVKITTGEIQSSDIGTLPRSRVGIQPLRFQASFVNNKSKILTCTIILKNQLLRCLFQ